MVRANNAQLEQSLPQDNVCQSAQQIQLGLVGNAPATKTTTTFQGSASSAPQERYTKIVRASQFAQPTLNWSVVNAFVILVWSIPAEHANHAKLVLTSLAIDANRSVQATHHGKMGSVCAWMVSMSSKANVKHAHLDHFTTTVHVRCYYLHVHLTAPEAQVFALVILATSIFQVNVNNALRTLAGTAGAATATQTITTFPEDACCAHQEHLLTGQFVVQLLL